MVEGAEDAFVIVDSNERICFVNPRGCGMFGYDAGDLIGQPLAVLLPERFRPAHGGLFGGFRDGGERSKRMEGRGDIWGMRRDGSEFPARASIVKVDEGDHKLIVAIVRDASEEYELHRELENQARRDPLTDLLNRRAFLEMAEAEVHLFKRFPRPFCLAMVDVDHFKLVNDTHGHPAGDQVIRTVGQICEGELREIDVMARLGGDEYALMLIATDEAGARVVCERIREAIAAAPFGFEKEPRIVTASLGIAQAATGQSVEEILERADEALYRAKADGRNRVAAAGEG